MPLNLLTFPHKKLVQKSRKVVDFSRIRPIISTMLRIMKKEDGVAIAAPQVGLHKRFFVADRGVLPHVAIVNPKWKEAEDSSLVPVHEGCLSFPGLLITVDRWDSIDVEYQDLDGESHQTRLSGFSAQVFQHETDHLDGVLMVDRLNDKR